MEGRKPPDERGIEMVRSKRFQLKKKYSELVRIGEYYVARKILRLLIDRKIIIGWSDSDLKVEHICEELDCHIHINSRNMAVIYDVAN